MLVRQAYAKLSFVIRTIYLPLLIQRGWACPVMYTLSRYSLQSADLRAEKSKTFSMDSTELL